MEYNTEAINEEVRKNGTTFAMLSGPSPVLEGIANYLRRETGDAIDWGYFGGRGMFSTLGDPTKAKKALRNAMPMIAIYDDDDALYDHNTYFEERHPVVPMGPSIRLPSSPVEHVAIAPAQLAESLCDQIMRNTESKFVVAIERAVRTGRTVLFAPTNTVGVRVVVTEEDGVKFISERYFNP